MKNLNLNKFNSIYTVLLFFRRVEKAWKASVKKRERNSKITPKIRYQYISDWLDQDEVDIIKNETDQKATFFSDNNLYKCLEFIIDEIVLRQGSNKQNSTPDKKNMKSFTLNLRINDLLFLLDVTESGRSETYLLNEFKSENNECYKIARELCKNETNSEITLGTTSSRFMYETRLNNALGKLFLPKSTRRKDRILKWHKTVHVNIESDINLTNTKALSIRLYGKDLEDVINQITALKSTPY